MDKKLVLLIFVLLFQIAECSSKHRKHPQKTIEAQDQHEFIPFKNAKKVRIPQKEEFKIKDFISSLNSFAEQINQFFGGVLDHLTLRMQERIKRQSVIYRENFASENGGAQILMVSSSKIKSAKAILRDDPDAYLFTADELPIRIVIGLKEQILIDSFVVQSGQVYSCIVQDFQLQGAFSLQKQEWIFLGNFTADNSFEPQEFPVQQRIIRYLRLTILSSYGKWKYFTLSEVAVYGEGLFSHAMESLLQADYNIEKNKTFEQGMNTTTHLQSKKHKNKFSNKQIHAKEILVQAFTEVADQQNTNKPTIKNVQDQTQKNQILQESKLNDSRINEKLSSKEKKTISNLKKKVNYLEKRNYELHQQIKQIKKFATQKINQLETKHKQKDSNQNHHILNNNQQSWYSFLLDSHWTILLCVIINFACLMLVWCFMLKYKQYQNMNKKSKRIENPQERVREDNNKDKNTKIKQK